MVTIRLTEIPLFACHVIDIRASLLPLSRASHPVQFNPRITWIKWLLCAEVTKTKTGKGKGNFACPQEAYSYIPLRKNSEKKPNQNNNNNKKNQPNVYTIT